MHKRNEYGMVSHHYLVAGVALAILSLVGVAITPFDESLAGMRLKPEMGMVTTGTLFPVQIVVDASVPVNVFKGELRFDPSRLQVASIDYNTSIAELWAERPWYANGEGTVNFIGGTTKTGGFTGSGVLITVNFRPQVLGDAVIDLRDTEILAHDGLGSDVPLKEPIDGLFTVEHEADKEVVIRTPSPSSIAVVERLPHTDLNNDGVQSIADVSIFFAGLITQKPEYDFNRDGFVDTKDLSIIMSAQ